ncbi:MAG TPA: hypothetical protein PKZ42_10995 [Syntrophales bacterium]|nr:hypothetical protein [Syntrophales bacterium]
MENRFLNGLRNNWKDIVAVLIVITFTVISIVVKYNLGMLIGFLVLFVFFTFDRIKKLIFDMNVKKIFGIEFGESEREHVKEKVREDVVNRGIGLSTDEIDTVTEAALNQVSGVAYKGRFYEELVFYALKDLDIPFITNLSGAIGKNRFSVDFVVDSKGSRVIGIEAAYSDRRYLSRDKIQQVIKSVNAFKKADNLSHFVLVTNSEVKEEDKKWLQEQQPPIDVIESTVSPDGVLSRLENYLKGIDRDRKGSLDPK